MHRLPIIFLLLSNLFIFSGCSISKYKHLKCSENVVSIAPVITSTSVLKYKASIDVLKNHLTGLLIVKQTDSTTKHLVFVTELGMKMFDFEAGKDGLKAVYVFEPLNKPLMIEALKRNFSNMFLLNTQGVGMKACQNKKSESVISLKSEQEKWFYTSSDNSTGILYPRLQETYHKRKRSSKINYIVDKTAQQPYTQITCKQYGLVKFYFELNAINPSND